MYIRVYVSQVYISMNYYKVITRVRKFKFIFKISVLLLEGYILLFPLLLVMYFFRYLFVYKYCPPSCLIWNYSLAVISFWHLKNVTQLSFCLHFWWVYSWLLSLIIALFKLLRMLSRISFCFCISAACP